MQKYIPKIPKLIGPPKTAANNYVYERLKNGCIECDCCGGQWNFKAKKLPGFAVQVNVGGRVMAVRKAMYLASFPEKAIQKDRRITSTCKNDNCINPALLRQVTAGVLLASHYTKGRRSKAQATAHLMTYIQANAKLTNEDVLAIRNDDRKGTEAAHEFGISAEHWNAIQRGDARSTKSFNPFAGLGAR